MRETGKRLCAQKEESCRLRITYLQIEHSWSSGLGDVLAIRNFEEGIELEQGCLVSSWTAIGWNQKHLESGVLSRHKSASDSIDPSSALQNRLSLLLQCSVCSFSCCPPSLVVAL